jgi:asparagine synthase (glutamine-hydrolysing)
MLIHLSGGMDSSSIVCMADEIEREMCPTNPSLVDTLSYFDSSEPDWDEEPFVAVVESHRRRKGIHLELSVSARTFTAPSASGASYLLPGVDSSSLSWERKVFSVVEPKGVRVFVTGNGGDEVLGGVPTPLPELADYVVAGKFGLLFVQAKRWCLANRSALLPMAKATASYLVDLYWRTDWECATVPPWVAGSRIRTSATERRTQVFSQIAHVRPSEIENERTWLRVLECLPHLQPGVMNRYEYRYPYLDRDLVEFLFSIPREQLARPGRRRSLMRRSLKDIVPQKILERKRKAFCARGPLIAVRRAGEMQKSLLAESKAAALGIADKRAIEVALQQVASGDGIEQIGALMRLLSFESWVRSQVEGGILRLPTETTADYCLSSRQ